MLDWLASKPPAGTHGSSHNEPPETPAHLFAVKAFKSAFFGTPAPTERPLSDDEDEDEAVPKADTSARISLPVRKLNVASKYNTVPSPTKGILLTPGTMGTRRKTVSFEQLSGQKASDPKQRPASAEDAQTVEAESRAQTASSRVVRRSLFKETTSDDKSSGSTNMDKGKQPQAASKVTEVSSASDGAEDSAADVTLDLEHPKSYSGRHWMEAYQRDHNKSKQEMKKVIKWSQSAKERAERRDRETIRLRDRLQKSDDRVKELENEVAKLSKDAEPGRSNSREVLSNRRGSGQDDQLVRLRKAAKDAEERVSKLQRENDNFKKTILRVKDEMAKYETRHKDWNERHKRKDERHAEQRKELRDKIVLQKTQYAEQLSKIEEEAAKEKARLLREIDFLRGEVTSASPAKFNPPDPTQNKDKYKENVRPVKSQKPSTKSKSQEPRQSETFYPDRSSPTILDNHLQKARGVTPRSSVIDLDLPQIIAVKSGVKTSASASAPKPATIHEQYTTDDEGIDDPPLPAVIAAKTVRPVVRARKGIRVKSRQPPTGSRATTALPPDREAAARMRIAHRSAEKQRDTRFLFEQEREKGKGKNKENRLPLLERLANV